MERHCRQLVVQLCPALSALLVRRRDRGRPGDQGIEVPGAIARILPDSRREIGFGRLRLALGGFPCLLLRRNRLRLGHPAVHRPCVCSVRGRLWRVCRWLEFARVRTQRLDKHRCECLLDRFLGSLRTELGQRVIPILLAPRRFRDDRADPALFALFGKPGSSASAGLACFGGDEHGLDVVRQLKRCEVGGGGACDAGEIRTHLEHRQGRFNAFAGDENPGGAYVVKTKAIALPPASR